MTKIFKRIHLMNPLKQLLACKLRHSAGRGGGGRGGGGGWESYSPPVPEIFYFFGQNPDDSGKSTW